MVQTRRQEQLLHTPPPGGQPGGEASPATPAGAAAAAAQGNGRALPLKSALKTGRKLRPSGPGEVEEEATPLGAGIKKRVRIHSSSNLVHEFTTSHSTEQAWMWEEEEEEEEEEDSERERTSDGERSGEGMPDSSGVRRGRTRRRTPSAAPSFWSLLLFGDGRRGRGGARGGGRRRGGSGAWLGMLFTLCWMAASSALIFANKVLMVSAGGCAACAEMLRLTATCRTWGWKGGCRRLLPWAAALPRCRWTCPLPPSQVDHGFRFPFALTAMGQGFSVLLGAWWRPGGCHCRALHRWALPCAGRPL